MLTVAKMVNYEYAYAWLLKANEPTLYRFKVEVKNTPNYYIRFVPWDISRVTLGDVLNIINDPETELPFVQITTKKEINKAMKQVRKKPSRLSHIGEQRIEDIILASVLRETTQATA